MRIVVAFDHRGVTLRATVVSELLALGHDVLDLGTDAPLPTVDYPDKAFDVGRAIADERAERGVLVCSSGVGAAIAANKIDGIRACLCHDTYTARQGVEHDAMNVLCLGSEIVGKAVAGEIVRAFAAADFDGSERSLRRLRKVEALERGEPLLEMLA